MPDSTILITFILAVLAMQIIPGPDMLIVVTRSITQGKRSAFFAACGIFSAGFIQVPLLVLSIGSLFELSETSFTLLKYIGAIYLMYIGLKYLFQSASKIPANAKINSVSSAFFQSFFSNLLNPKVLVFLLAFFPQFIDPSQGSVISQVLILGVIMKTCGFLVMISVALMANKLGNKFNSSSLSSQWKEKLVGSIFVGLGLKLLFTEHLPTN